MTYTILGQDLHEVADRARKHFANTYGATKFVCEEDLQADLPLRPTWQADLKNKYRLCIDVRASPFSSSLYAFVAQCVQRGAPVKLWVAVPHGGASATAELKDARDAGVGVVEFRDDGSVYELHKPVPLSLYALKKTDLGAVPKYKREEIKGAEDTFLAGDPVSGCQSMCQELEWVTRKFGEYSYNSGWWKQANPPRKLPISFFRTKAWATMLAALEERIDEPTARKKCAQFEIQAVVRARGHTDLRNSVSHKPKNSRELQRRDARLRTMYESTRDLVIDWHTIVKPLRFGA